jgi:hypothetical protein
MDGKKDNAANELALLKAFRDGMIKRHFGLYIDSNYITEQGLDDALAAADGLRALRPNGIHALEPLLDDPDPGVRSGAGDYLLHEMPGKALPVLEALAKSAELEASMTARVALWFYDKEKSLN